MTEHDMTHRESIEIAASPHTVYDTIRQLERMGEWSPENIGGSWVEGDGSNVGDRFEGINRMGEREWSAVATIGAATPGALYAFHTGPVDDPLVQWSYEMTSTDGGTRVTETWDVVKLPPTLAGSPPERLAARKAQVQQAMATTLANLKASLEG